LNRHELVLIGSPETVAKKIHAAAESGLFNTFMGEFNFSDLPERDLMRSIRLFGEKVISGATRVRTVLMPRSAP
jgi:alkanesulfonate monooxygenase SsuD/methylene tetrahydromethanopterin reductase-like flavin-dependent oxidoreductase (luciferase family)